MNEPNPKYRPTLVDRDGFVLVAFTIFSPLLLGFSIYMSNGVGIHNASEQTENATALAP
jgi:hypothetical protein